MIDNPPSRRAGRPPGRRPGAPAAGAFAILAATVALTLIGCGVAVPTTPPSPGSAGPTTTPTAAATASGTRSSDAAGLVVAAVEGGRSLGLVAMDGSLRPLADPPHPIRQIRATTNGLVAVLDDGTLSTGSLGAGAASWVVVPGLAGIAAVAPDPSGRSLALLDSDRLGHGLPLALRITDITGATPRTATADGLQANGGPAWLSDGRIALRALTAGEQDVLALVDPGSGPAMTIPLDAIDLVASGDGSTVAFLDLSGIRVVPASALDSTDGRQVAMPTDPAAGTIADAALDGRGQRIAFVWADEDGQPRSIRVATAASGWTESARIDVPAGTNRVLVAWMP